jgi:predicted metalloprotease with PDZ domain
MSAAAPRGLMAVSVAGVLLLGVAVRTETAVSYQFTFPEPQHHWMAVEAVFNELSSQPLELRMSRSSPGRYALHDFAKNVYDVQALGPDGRPLPVSRPDAHGWTVDRHGPSITVRYKVFGDRVDGTYLGVDPTHAHMNMPATIMWARGLENRPVRLTFTPPANAGWQAATQLYPTDRPFEFTAPNLQYLMDSPTELGPVSIREFEVDGRRIRFAAHHTGTAAQLESFVADVKKIVVSEREVFGEFPVYEPGSYTFIADYLPYANGDGMEHRNSTVITSSGAIATNRNNLLAAVAHEFFHCWNVERIRPRSLEPFDFERANMSGELWLGEGFTQYYEPLSMSRAGVADLRDTLNDFLDLMTAVTLSPGREIRSAEDMSRMAVFADGGRSIDRTNWANSYISYYPFGGAIALALDLSLRQRFDGRVSLDDFMRAMWRVHGKPDAPRPGYVAHPYTIDDAEQRLADITSDKAFASDFFTRYIHGRELPDYPALLAQAGLVLRKQRPGRAWMGDVRLESRGGLIVADATRANTPAYKAGLDLGDEIRTVGGSAVASAEAVAAIVQRHKPGDVLLVEYVDRTRVPKTAKLTLEEDPRLELVTIESTGRQITPSQSAFRRAWLERRG